MNGVTARFRSSHLRMWMSCIAPPRIKMSIRKRNKKERFEESWRGTMATTESMQQPGSLPGRSWYWKQGFHKAWLIENQLWFYSDYKPSWNPSHQLQTSRILSTLGAGGGNSTYNTPGHWRRGQEGELDETRLVDALAGEANVFRRDFSLKVDGMIESPQSKLERLGWFIFHCACFIF